MFGAELRHFTGGNTRPRPRTIYGALERRCSRTSRYYRARAFTVTYFRRTPGFRVFDSSRELVLLWASLANATIVERTLSHSCSGEVTSRQAEAL